MAPKEVSFTLRAVNAASSVLKTVQRDVTSIAKSFFSLGGAITAAAAGFTFGKILKDSVQQAAEAELGMMRLQQTIENVGGSFTELKPDIESVLSSLAKSTTFKDDDLVAGLQELTIVSGDAKGSIAALGLAADIAKAKKMDLSAAATLVGKVMVGETGMLKKQGIVLKEGADAMQQLQQRFGGFAANEGKSLTGTLQRIANGWEQFEQALGRALTKGEAGKGVLGGLVDKLASMEQWVVANEDSIATFTSAIATLAGWLLDLVGGGLKYAVIGFRTLYMGLDTTATLLVNLSLAGKVAFGELLKVMGEWLEQSAGFFDQFGIHVDELGEKLANLGNKWKNSALNTQRQNRADLWAGWGALGDSINGSSAPKLSPTSGGAGGALPRVGVSAADTKAVDALRASLAELLRTTADGDTKASAFAAKIAKWTLEASKSKMSINEQRKALAALNATLAQIKVDEAVEAFKELDAALLEATGDVVQKATAELGKKLDELKKKAKNVTDPAEQQRYNAELAKLSGMYDAQIKALGEVEDSKKRLKAIDEWLITHPAIAMSQGELDAWGQQLEDEIKRIETALQDPKLTEGARKALQDQLDAARGEMDKWGDAVAAHIQRVVDGWNEAADAAQNYRDRVAGAVEGTAALARGIIAASSAMGLMDRETQAIANDIANLAEATAKLIASGGSDVASWVQAIGSIADLGVKAFGGETREEKAKRIHILYENTAAIKRLTEKVGLLGTNVSGASAGRALSLLSDPSIIWGASKSKVKGFERDDWQFLIGVAEALGLTLDGTVGSLRQLRDALGSATGHLAQFDNSVAGQRGFAEMYNQIFGQTGISALQTLTAPAQQASPVVSGLFAGIDINSPEGQAELRKRAQELFLRMAPGGANPIGTDELGGLSGGDLQQIIQDIINALNGLDGAATPAATALETLNAALHHIDVEAEILGTSKADVLAARVKEYGKVFPEFAGLLDGLDLSKADDLDKLKEKLRALFKGLEDGAITLPEGTAFDDFVAAILAMLGATNDAAAGIETAAQKIAAAASTLQTDWEVFGTSAKDQAQQLADLYGFNLGDISTQGGRDAAIAQLQAKYSANRDNKDLAQQILSVIRALRGVKDDPSAAGDLAGIAGGASGLEGATSASVSGFQAMTTLQGDQVLDVMRGVRENTRTIADRMLNGSSLGTSGSGGGASIRVGPINIDVIAQGADPRQFGTQIGDEIIREINIRLGQGSVLADFLRGNVGRS